MNFTATQQPSSPEPQSLNHTEEYDGDGTTLHLPTSTQPDESWYWGAYVSVDSAGINTNIIYPDLSSMYPNLLRSLNISPDTIVGEQSDLDESQYTEDDCFWAYIDPRPVKRCEDHEHWQDFTDGTYKAVQRKKDGSWKTPDGGKCGPPQYERCYFLKPSIKVGFITNLVDDFMERKNAAKGTDLYGATKATVNALYGTLGFSTEYNSFRLFDHRLAEGVTLAGRKVLKYTRDSVIEYAENNGIEAYATHSDTDGVGISLDVDDRVEALELGEEATDHLREEGYGQFLVDEFGYDEDDVDYHTLDAEIEYYAPRIYNHDRKKRYASHTTWRD